MENSFEILKTSFLLSQETTLSCCLTIAVFETKNENERNKKESVNNSLIVLIHLVLSCFSSLLLITSSLFLEK